MQAGDPTLQRYRDFEDAVLVRTVVTRLQTHVGLVFWPYWPPNDRTPTLYVHVRLSGAPGSSRGVPADR